MKLGQISSSFSDWFPDDLGPIDDQFDVILIQGSDLSFANRQTVVQPTIILVITQVKGGGRDLTATNRLATSID